MTDLELKKLKDDLWHAADVLRSGAHLAANKYGQPILGLIFLRYADILFKQHKQEIETEYEKLKGGRREKSIVDITIEKCGFYLPEEAYYDYINNAPDDAQKAKLVKEAMEAIEMYNPSLMDVLPKDVYEQLVPEEEPELLSRIIRIFKDIPENSTLDIFGEIYEYFLGNFALAEGKDGGTFYTPSTVVRYMVEVLSPEPGGEKKFLDPACGSGGMFVQAARYMHNHNADNEEMMNFRCYGVEKEPDTVKLAKMNLLLNNVRGDIREANTFYADPHNAVGAFDYVMANPPFNVDEVAYDRVKDDPRFNTYGVPRKKSSSSKKKADKKETVPNANYLWIGHFATALNEKGKAALVMANSASDASGSEYDIRKKMIEEGIISQMVTLSSNMFNTVTLPATLWFFDKQKAHSDKKDEILFIDARNVYTQVDRAHRKFSDEQIKNLGIITKLYHGDEDSFKELVQEYEGNLTEQVTALNQQIKSLAPCHIIFEVENPATDEKEEKEEDFTWDLDKLDMVLANHNAELLHGELKKVNKYRKEFARADKWINSRKVKRGQSAEVQTFKESIANGLELVDGVKYYLNNLLWLKEKFPEGKYRDVIGLCKAAKLEGEDGIIDQDYSLNAGRYVGVAVEDDGMSDEEFKEEMLGLSQELRNLQDDSDKLTEDILNNLKELGI
ncbi:class I SAM-dependent DNA methyltransferase [Selenomonas ruminantium]|uniref:type I restriction-modification system subunit M n=1 Tax=Selenomonas ruminantium TaxID=971 RepID=UPI0026F27673|nr:class I SAM-dependent DNA methyltransferase [Selenomonas ruminantium]